MNINKKLDRMKQWTGERMGKEVKSGQTDEFKMLETEMQLRHEGMYEYKQRHDDIRQPASQPASTRDPDNH